MLVDTCQCPCRNIDIRFARYCYCTMLQRVTKLPMAALHSYLLPTIRLEHFDQFSNFHFQPELMLFSSCITLRITGWQWSEAELPVRVDAVVRFRPSLPGSAVYQLAHLLDPPPTAFDLGPYAPQLQAQYR